MEPSEKVGVIFDGTFEGFLTVLYKYYYEKLRPSELVAENGFQQSIGTKYVTVETDETQAEKALGGIQKKLGGVYGRICGAFINSDPTRYIHIFNYTILCFKHGEIADGYTHIDCVIRTYHYARQTGREIQLLSGFTRFAETAGGVMYADISPEHEVLPMLADFFKDRLAGHKWVLHDTRRMTAAVCNGSDYIFTDAPELAVKIKTAEGEERFQELWTLFYNTLAIKERTNPKLRRQLMPKRYWKHMTEHKIIDPRDL